MHTTRRQYGWCWAGVRDTHERWRPRWVLPYTRRFGRKCRIRIRIPRVLLYLFEFPEIPAPAPEIPEIPKIIVVSLVGILWLWLDPILTWLRYALVLLRRSLAPGRLRLRLRLRLCGPYVLAGFCLVCPCCCPEVVEGHYRVVDWGYTGEGKGGGDSYLT